MLPFTSSSLRPLSIEQLVEAAESQEPEFGTNTGRQGLFDPRNRRHAQTAAARLSELEAEYGDRLRYNYSGDTGLMKNDGRGYARYQNAITEADNIRRIFGEQQPRSIRYGGELSSKPPVEELGDTDQKATGTGRHYQSTEDWIRSRGFR